MDFYVYKDHKQTGPRLEPCGLQKMDGICDLILRFLQSGGD